ncbi:MAG: LysR family transcriptional regulator [bacterium]|jgi:DNA-binding transcriptional LysR family regulator
MEYQWLKDFVHLAETRSFSRAAELSHISQPAFSRRIRGLEDWVGTSLIDRSTSPARLTFAGEQFLAVAYQTIANLEVSREKLKRLTQQAHPQIVTFAVQHSISWRFYPEWLQHIEPHFEGITPHLRADDLPECVRDLRAEKADFVISYESPIAAGVFDLKGLRSMTLGKDRLIPVSQPDENHFPEFHLSDQGDVEVPILGFGAQAPLGRQVESILHRRGLMRRARFVYNNSMSGILRLKARNGGGIAWLPESLVEGDLASGALVRAGDPSWDLELEIQLHRLAETDSPVVSKIWNILQSLLVP